MIDGEAKDFLHVIHSTVIQNKNQTDDDDEGLQIRQLFRNSLFVCLFVDPDLMPYSAASGLRVYTVCLGLTVQKLWI